MTVVSPISGISGDNTQQRCSAKKVEASLAFTEVPQPVLLLGSGGMLGRAWEELLVRNGIEHVSLGHGELDVARRDAVDGALHKSYRLVVNCTAWTDVDGAETNETSAFAVNADGPQFLARRCRQLGVMLVHYSTDYVFRGDATRPYQEQDPVDPQGVYAKSKAEGDQCIQDSGCRHLIIRISGLYAPWGKNFVRTMVRLLQSKNHVRVVNDQRLRVTSATEAAAGSMGLVKLGIEGIVNLAGEGDCTWYEFACQIGRHLGSKCEIEPVRTDQYPVAAPRPAYSVLDLAKARSLIGGISSWQEQLASVLAQREE